MLRGDRAELADVLPAAEAVLEEVHLIHDLPRVDQELLTLTRYGELAPAVEDPDAELVLDLLKGRREAGLGWEMKSRLAARLTERLSAMARMYLIC